MSTNIPRKAPYSFFDAPLPRVNKEMFPVDPAILGRSIPRPCRPIGQISKRFANTPIKTLQPECHEVRRSCCQSNMFE